MDNTTIQKFLDEHDYDIRKTHNGRWIDQKCTMDVVCLVSDCIVEYTSNREDKRFRDNLLGKNKAPIIYDFYLYQTVLNTGLGTEEFYEIQELDFDGLLNCIEKYYV